MATSSLKCTVLVMLLIGLACCDVRSSNETGAEGSGSGSQSVTESSGDAEATQSEDDNGTSKTESSESDSDVSPDVEQDGESGWWNKWRSRRAARRRRWKDFWRRRRRAMRNKWKKIIASVKKRGQEWRGKMKKNLKTIQKRWKKHRAWFAKRRNARQKRFRRHIRQWKAKWRKRWRALIELRKRHRNEFRRKMARWRARIQARWRAWQQRWQRFKEAKVKKLHVTKTLWYPRPVTAKWATSLPKNKCWIPYASIILNMNAYHYHKAAKSPFGNLDGFGYKYGVKNCGVFDPKYLLDSKWSDSQAEISVNEERKIAAFAFRGTEVKFKDIFTDILFFPKACRLGRGGRRIGFVHSGFCQAYQTMRRPFLRLAKRYYRRGYKLLITGHSLGAALATLGMLDVRYEINPAKDRFFATTFGSPRVGTRNFKRVFQKARIPVSRFVNYYARGQCAPRWNRRYHHCKRLRHFFKKRCLSRLVHRFRETIRKKASELVTAIPPRWAFFYRHVGKTVHLQCMNPCRKGSMIKMATECHQPWQYLVALERKGQEFKPRAVFAK